MKTKHSVDTLFALLLYGLFALLALLLVLIGARVYGRIVGRSAARGDARAALSYVANKIRAGETKNGLRLETRGGCPLLVIEETDSGQVLETLIYYHDGSLRELFQEAGTPFVPADGERLVSIPAFAITEADGLLTITITDTQQQPHELYLQRRTGSYSGG